MLVLGQLLNPAVDPATRSRRDSEADLQELLGPIPSRYFGGYFFDGLLR